MRRSSRSANSAQKLLQPINKTLILNARIKKQRSPAFF
jgi:hypothetical protein